MKSLALILASVALAPLLFLASRGAGRESWPQVALALGAAAIVLALIRYFVEV